MYNYCILELWDSVLRSFFFVLGGNASGLFLFFQFGLSGIPTFFIICQEQKWAFQDTRERTNTRAQNRHDGMINDSHDQ